jgi:hypothetical protein
MTIDELQVQGVTYVSGKWVAENRVGPAGGTIVSASAIGQVARRDGWNTVVIANGRFYHIDDVRKHIAEYREAKMAATVAKLEKLLAQDDINKLTLLCNHGPGRTPQQALSEAIQLSFESTFGETEPA